MWRVTFHCHGGFFVFVFELKQEKNSALRDPDVHLNFYMTLGRRLQVNVLKKD